MCLEIFVRDTVAAGPIGETPAFGVDVFDIDRDIHGHIADSAFGDAIGGRVITVEVTADGQGPVFVFRRINERGAGATGIKQVFADHFLHHREKRRFVHGGSDGGVVGGSRAAGSGLNPSFGIVAIGFYAGPEGVLCGLYLLGSESIADDEAAVFFKVVFLLGGEMGHG